MRSNSALASNVDVPSHQVSSGPLPLEEHIDVKLVTLEDHVLLRRFLAALAPARSGSDGARLVQRLLQESQPLQAAVRSFIACSIDGSGNKFVPCGRAARKGRSSRVEIGGYSKEVWGQLMSTLTTIETSDPLHALLKTLRQEAAEMLQARRALEASVRHDDGTLLTAGASLARVMAARGWLPHAAAGTGSQNVEDRWGYPEQCSSASAPIAQISGSQIKAVTSQSTSFSWFGLLTR